MKPRQRLTGFDFVLLSFFLLCAVGIGVRIAGMRGFFAADRRETGFLVADAAEIPAEEAACLFAGEEVYTASGELFGTLTGVETLPARVSLSAGGKFYSADSENGDVSLTVYLTLAGVWEDGVFLRDGKYAVLSGDTVALYTKRASLKLRILAVKPTENGILRSKNVFYVRKNLQEALQIGRFDY